MAAMLAAVPAKALDADATGTEIGVTYKEPGTKADGTRLDDLNYTTIYYDAGEGPVKVSTVPATTPAGGGRVQRRFVVEVQEGKEVGVKVWATATDKARNESAKSQAVTIPADRLAPAAPE